LISLAAALLQRDLPGATCAFYVANDDDLLVVSHAAGRLAPALRGFTIGVGVGLSGWVAANRQSVVNSDASLDLAALGIPPRQHMCMSTPLVDRGAFVGVLTLYSDSSRPITSGSERMMEALAPHVASILGRVCATRAAEDTGICRPSDSSSGHPRRAWVQPTTTAQ
jgi:GAF domain-containing protein